MQAINLQTMPFSAYSLIEASAGTGKTYTISQLVLRLVLLGKDGSKPLAIDNILVVTFTKAATQELKDRVRANLVDAFEQVKQWQASGLLEQTPLNISSLDATFKQAQQDPFLAIIIDALVQQRCIHVQMILQAAIFQMDEAPIFTIHSFSQRMLSEYALLAGKPLQQELVEQSQPVMIQIAQTFWREVVYHFSAAQTALVLNTFKTPRELADKLSVFLKDDLIDTPVFDSLDDFHAACHAAEQLFTQAQQYWLNEEAELRAMFDVKGLGGSYRSNHLAARFSALHQYVNTGMSTSGLLGSSNKISYFFQSTLEEKCKQPIKHALFECLDTLKAQQEKLQIGLYALFRRLLQEKLKQYKQDNNICFFDDLISQFAEVLTQDNLQSHTLQHEIRQRFPVALIDEFQDTDKQQFTIFDAIYQQDDDASLMMIGDPKQAIYSFRGADIQTYFSARDCVKAEQQYTLGMNWRSLPALVSGVNTMFAKRSNAFVQKDFPTYPLVSSPGTFDSWQGLQLSDASGQKQAAALSVFTQTEQLLNKEDGMHFVAEQTAEFLAGLLANNTPINDQPIQPKDIAILVRKSAQAKAMQSALLAQGLNSIFLSKDTVLDCAEAPDFIQLIQACVNPFDTSIVLAALGGSLIGFELDTIQQLNKDPSALFDIQERFSQAKNLAESKGFIVMWQWLVNHFDIATTLLKQQQGERRLTNIHQLAEIAHAQLPAFDLELQFQSFIDAYLQATQGEGDQDNSQKLRLESEANLIEIVTIHASKGLEYPMVCCPFVSSVDDVRAGFNRVYNAEQLAYEIVWQATDEQKRCLAEEQLAEDVRLLYVAFTRAKYHLNISWQPFKSVEKTPLWHIIADEHWGTKVAELGDDFSAFFKQLKSCVMNPVVSSKTAEAELANNKRQNNTQWHLKTLQRNFYEPRVARSYSALLSSHGGAHHQGAEINEEGEAEWESVTQEALANDEGQDVYIISGDQTLPDTEENDLNMFHFPRGAHAGNFLHLLYETIYFDDESTFNPCIEKLSGQYLIEEKWQACLFEHTQQFMQKPLAPIAACLADLNVTSIKKEMGFHLMAKPTQGSEIAKILSQYRGGEGVETLSNIDGLFKGFIDLTFEADGTFYVLDYKSNHLGDNIEAYDEAAMHDAMLAHNYDLQYLIYTCALHIYLQQRIKNYDYNQHIGGIFYIFLRGINAENNAGIYYKQPSLNVIKRLARCFEVGDIPAALATNNKDRGQ